MGPTSFTTGLPFAKTARGRIAVDGEMRVLQHIDPEKAQGTEVHKPSDVSKQGVLKKTKSLCFSAVIAGASQGSSLELARRAVVACEAN